MRPPISAATADQPARDAAVDLTGKLPILLSPRRQASVRHVGGPAFGLAVVVAVARRKGSAGCGGGPDPPATAARRYPLPANLSGHGSDRQRWSEDVQRIGGIDILINKPVVRRPLVVAGTPGDVERTMVLNYSLLRLIRGLAGCSRAWRRPLSPPGVAVVGELRRCS